MLCCKTFKNSNTECLAKLSTVIVVVCCVTSLCHDVTMLMTLSDVSRCPECRILSVIPGSPSVLRSLCHRPGPWLCPAAHSRVSRCPGCPRHASRDQVRDTGDTRHWPAPAGLSGPPGPLRLLCSSQSLSASRDLVTGHWSLVTLVTLVTGHPGHLTSLLHQPHSIHPLFPKHS